jgi:hypothetical protein
VDKLVSDWSGFVSERTRIEIKDVEYLEAEKAVEKLNATLKNELSEEQNELFRKIEENLNRMSAIEQDKAYLIGFLDAMKLNNQL